MVDNLGWVHLQSVGGVHGNGTGEFISHGVHVLHCEGVHGKAAGGGLMAWPSGCCIK